MGDKGNFGSASLETIANNIRNGKWKAQDVMEYFIDASHKAQKETNCITQHLDEYALSLAKELDDRIKNGEIFDPEIYPLLGVPFSVKDCIDIKGFPTVAGFKAMLDNVALEDAGIVKMFRDFGGIPFCKTNICQFAMSSEGSNPVYGTTLNAYSKKYTPGGSSSGEGPLISLGGSPLGIGSDIGGSLRYPAAFNGIYTIKATSSLFPSNGMFPFEKGQTYIKATVGPMTRTMEDLQYISSKLYSANRLKYDPTVLPYVKEKFDKTKLRIGYYSSNEILPTTPAVERAVNETVKMLKDAGHELVKFEFKELDRAFYLATKIFSADLRSYSLSLLSDEGFDTTLSYMPIALSIPIFIRRMLVLLLDNAFGESLIARSIGLLIPSTAGELWQYQAELDEIFDKFYQEYSKLDIDVLLTPVTTYPSHPHGKFKDAIAGTAYTMVFNALNLPAGILPVTKVNPDLDSIDIEAFIKEKFGDKPTFGKYGIHNLYGFYDAKDMEGLPVGIQISGKRFDDEKVIQAMRIVDECIKKAKE